MVNLVSHSVKAVKVLSYTQLIKKKPSQVMEKQQLIIQRKF